MNHFVCVGGTGSRIGEAFVYLAATGYFGSGTTKIWIVDKDTQCGNGATLRNACTKYSNFRNECRLDDSFWFSQELTLGEWNFDNSLEKLNSRSSGKSAFKELSGNDETTSAVMKFLHDAESLDNTMAYGFYGRAQTGTAIYKAIEKATNSFVSGEKESLFTEIKTQVAHGEKPVIYLAGSSFGATGASLLPNMAKTLRTQFKGSVAIGAVLMMPYFSYSSSPNDDHKALVTPEEHLNKAQEALRYYGNGERMTIRQIGNPIWGNDQGLATLDAFYLIGCNPIRDINQVYCEGGEGQNNSAHIAELYAAMGAKHFFSLASSAGNMESKADIGTPAIYSYCLGASSTKFDWGRIDPMLEKPVLVLARFAVAALTYLHPMMHQEKKLTQDTILQSCFGSSGLGLFSKKVARVDEAELRRNTEVAADFSKLYLDYLYQVTNIGPDVELFESTFLDIVKSGLGSCAPDYAARLRDMVLADQYDFNARTQIIYPLCQLQRIRVHPTSGLSKDAKVSSTGLLNTEVVKGMNSIKTANVQEGNYTQHTKDGIKRMYEIVYQCAAEKIPM